MKNYILLIALLLIVGGSFIGLMKELSTTQANVYQSIKR